MHKLLIRLLGSDPLLGFILAGGGIFLLYGLIGEPAPARETIVVTADTIADIVHFRGRLLERELSQRETEELIDDFLDEEILIREAVSRGLHLSDGKVRQRLHSKMEFLIAEDAPEPTAADLELQRAADPGRYMTPRTVTFEHVFFGRDRPAATDLMKNVDRTGTMPDGVGETFWLGRRMVGYSASQLLVLLGGEFIQALGTMPLGQWSGPFKSRRGWHLVRIERFDEPVALSGEQAQQRLRADWAQARRKEARAVRIAALRDRYEVVMPRPEEARLSAIGTHRPSRMELAAESHR